MVDRAWDEIPSSVTAVGEVEDETSPADP